MIARRAAIGAILGIFGIVPLVKKLSRPKYPEVEVLPPTYGFKTRVQSDPNLELDWITGNLNGLAKHDQDRPTAGS